MSVVLFLTIFLSVLILMILAIHWSFRAPRLMNERTPKDYGLVFDEIEFVGNQKTLIHAWWLPAGKDSEKTIVILHGWGANKSLLMPLAKAFHKTNYNVFMLDAHNHGQSEARGVASMPKFSEDLDSAIQWVRLNRSNQSKVVCAVGHSVGAAAVLLSAARTKTANAYISIASFSHPQLMIQRHLGILGKIPLLVGFLSNYVQKVIGHRFEEIAPINTIQQVSNPVLCLHGNRDKTIPITDMNAMCLSADPLKVQCFEIPEADHDSIELIEKNFSIIQRFLKLN